MQMRLFRDRHGFPRAEATPPCEVLGWFLEQDIQSDAEWGQELVQLIDDVSSGNIDGWAGTGNAHTLTLTPQGAIIESEYAEPPARCDLSLSDLKKALQDWIVFVGGPQ